MLFQRLANRILYSDPSLRPPAGLLAQNHRGASGLWAHGISGDLPIVLVRIDEVEDVDIVRQLLRAHEYWRLKLLDVDLVILNEHGPDLRRTASRTSSRPSSAPASRAGHEAHEGHGRVYILRGDQLSTEDRTLLQAAARAVLLSRRGSLADQVIRLERPERRGCVPAAATRRDAGARRTPRSGPELEFFNGLGGFADGRARVRHRSSDRASRRRRRGSNVVANPSFGFLVSESGSGYTWSENSRENQLTPWSNDPVSDPVGEAIYVRDDETGELWGPTALPIRLEESTYVARHGPGYSRFEHVARRDRARPRPVRAARRSPEDRRPDDREPVRPATAPVGHGVRRVGPGHVARGRRAVDRHRPRADDRRAAGAQSVEPGLRRRGSRSSISAVARRRGRPIGPSSSGRNGALDRPAGLERGHRLGAASGAGLDPCAALQTSFELAPGERTEVRVLLGQADIGRGGRDLVRRGRALDHAAALRAVAALLGRGPGSGPGPDPGSVDGHPAQRLAALPDPGLSASGRGRRSTRPVAPTASATSSRTSSR